MDLNKIKCVIVDFDKTLYSDADMSRVNTEYAEFLFEKKLVDRTETAIDDVLKKYPQWHMFQCCFYIARQNGISDDETKQWFAEHIYDITRKGFKKVDARLMKKLCQKFPVYILSDSINAHLMHYIKMFNYNPEWFAGVVSNDFKLKSMSKCRLMKKIVKKENLKNDEVIMIGDSLRSDIKAANEAGIESCLVKDVKDTEKIFKKLLKNKG